MLKKLLAGAVSLMLASSLFVMGASAAKSIKGDVNGSGNVDIEDAVNVIGYVNGNTVLSDSSLKAGDIDRNGVVDIEDAVAVIGSVNGTAPIVEDKLTDTSDITTVTALFNSAYPEAAHYDVDAEFDSSWDVVDDTEGFCGMYNDSDTGTIIINGFCLGSDSFKDKSPKELVKNHLPKMTLDHLELINESERPFKGWDSYTLEYTFHLDYDDISEDFIVSDTFVSYDDDKMALICTIYSANSKDAAVEKIKPVLDSVNFTDSVSEDEFYLNRLNPFEDLMIWGDVDDDIDSDEYESFYTYDAGDFNVVPHYENTLLFQCYDEHTEPAILNVYMAGRKSEDFKSKSVKDIAKAEFDSLNIGKDAEIKINSEEETKFNGYDAYHFDIDYLYDDIEPGYYGSHDDWNVDVYFVKQDDKVIVVVSTMPRTPEKYVEFSNEKLDPILNSIKFK